MTKLEKTERETATLPQADLFKLANWFGEFHADLWDKQIEEDSKAGRLDKLFAEAGTDIVAGTVRPL